ncbi:MFS transporter [Clostridium paraputrificum]|uniref:MFS transporter n=1 Tax=Clostridium paraputrificum TaxID=29363 RepID=UPI003D32D258
MKRIIMKIGSTSAIKLLGGQAVSQFGSLMTTFAVIIWAYGETQSEFLVSLLAFFSYLPYILVGIFASVIVDKFKKKNIMLITDGAAAICSLIMLVLFKNNILDITNIFVLIFIINIMNAFQTPASSVALGLIIPKEKYSQINGVNSVLSSINAIFHPMIATAILSFYGIEVILFIDIITFIIGEIILILIKIPEVIEKKDDMKPGNIFTLSLDGMKFIFSNKTILCIVVSFAIMNFLTYLTYENILPAMILSKTSNNFNTLGYVSATLGIGSLIGGAIVTFLGTPKNKIKVIFFCAAFSFLFGDILMGLGSNMVAWILAALAASVPAPFIMAAQTEIMYTEVPVEMQGRVFSIKNSVQYSTIPIALLLGGFLAQYIFEPAIVGQSNIATSFVGNQSGSGMGLMFVFTGAIGFLSCYLLFKNKHIRSLSHKFEGEIIEVKEY